MATVPANIFAITVVMFNTPIVCPTRPCVATCTIAAQRPRPAAAEPFIAYRIRAFSEECLCFPRTISKTTAQHPLNIKKAGVVPLICYRGFCIPLWTVFPPLQVVLSSACSVASLSRFPNHYLPGHPHLREGALAAYLFGQGSPSTWCAELTAVHDTPSAQLPCGAQRSVTHPRYKPTTRQIQADGRLVDIKNWEEGLKQRNVANDCLY